MSVERSRRRFLAGGTALAVVLVSRIGAVVRADALSDVTVYKTPT
jgi:hypothetical protein